MIEEVKHTELMIAQGVAGGQIDTGGATIDDRQWLDDAIRTAGGEVTDGGFGCGSADLGFTVNGVSYGVTLRRRAPCTPAQTTRTGEGSEEGTSAKTEAA